MLGKLPVPGRPTDLNSSRARAYCACSRCGWGLVGHFSLVYLFSFLSPSLGGGPYIETEILSKRAAKPNKRFLFLKKSDPGHNIMPPPTTRSKMTICKENNVTHASRSPPPSPPTYHTSTCNTERNNKSN